MPVGSHGIEMPDPDVRFYREHFFGQGMSALGMMLTQASPTDSVPPSPYVSRLSSPFLLGQTTSRRWGAMISMAALSSP